MVAATENKNKRGRPEKFSPFLYAAFAGTGKERRAVQNIHFASEIAMRVLEQKPGDFFISPNGNFRRQGIAEKIGRLYCDGYITAQEAKEMAGECVQLYEQGATCKELEKTLSLVSKNLKARTT